MKAGFSFVRFVGLSAVVAFLAGECFSSQSAGGSWRLSVGGDLYLPAMDEVEKAVGEAAGVPSQGGAIYFGPIISINGMLSDSLGVGGLYRRNASSGEVKAIGLTDNNGYNFTNGLDYGLLGLWYEKGGIPGIRVHLGGQFGGGQAFTSIRYGNNDNGYVLISADEFIPIGRVNTGVDFWIGRSFCLGLEVGYVFASANKMKVTSTSNPQGLSGYLTGYSKGDVLNNPKGDPLIFNFNGPDALISLKYAFGYTISAEDKAAAAAEKAAKAAGTSSFGGGAAGSKTLAVGQFDPQNVSAGDAAVIADMFRNELIKGRSFSVVEKSNMDKILQEQAFQQSGCTSSECAVKLGKILNVRYLIVGSFGKLMTQYVLSLRVIDVETAQAVYSDLLQMKDADSVSEGVRTMAARLTTAVQKGK